MQPYYEHAGITIYHGDNRAVLPLLDAGSVDLVFTSPPYNLGISPGGNGKGFYTPSRGGRNVTKWAGFNGYGTHDDAMPMDEYREWQQSVLLDCWGLLSERGTIFYNHKPRLIFGESWLPLELNPGLPLRQILIWDSGRGLALGDGHFCPAVEWIMFFAKPSFRFETRAGSAIGDIWRVPRETEARGHPCPFPQELPGHALAVIPRGVVLDPHMGIGSTLAAAKLHHWDAIGIEIEERYCEIAAKRLAQEVLF